MESTIEVGEFSEWALEVGDADITGVSFIWSMEPTLWMIPKFLNWRVKGSFFWENKANFKFSQKMSSDIDVISQIG